jgi:hypothetical protein
MASHRSTDASPADDQAFAEAFDEDKHASQAEMGRPDRDKEDGHAEPVDQSLDGARGERFGEAVSAEPDDLDPVQAGPGADETTAPRKATPDTHARSKQDEEARLDEAMKETFPASDPPPIRPGE